VSRLDDRPAPIRWVLRTLLHAIDGHAWIGSVVGAILAGAWAIESLVGTPVANSLSTASANAIGSWTGRASVVILAGVLIQGAARAGIDEGMARLRRNPSHVRDLQQQAGVMRQYLRQPYSYPSIDLRSVAIRNLCQHFPLVAAEIENWNYAAVAYRHDLDALNLRRDREAALPIFGVPTTFSGVLTFVAMGNYSAPLDLIWSVEAQTSLQFRDPKTDQYVGVSNLPAGVDPFEFVAKVQDRLEEARNWPEALRYRESVQRLEALKPGLDRLLEGVQLDHVPGGACGTCRPSEASRKR
jgi:hypothetical protein